MQTYQNIAEFFFQGWMYGFCGSFALHIVIYFTAAGKWTRWWSAGD